MAAHRRLTQMHSRRPALCKALAVSLSLLACIGAYVGTLTYRWLKFYRFIQKQPIGIVGEVFKADPEIGFGPVAGATGMHVFPGGDAFPMRFDKDGFHSPVDPQPAAGNGTTLLALGCSFTYGDSVRAKDTFPELVANRIGAKAMNAGVNAHGLAQMVLRARSIIPRYRPDDILLQYSPRLPEQARTPFAPTYYGQLPGPYFYDANGDLASEPPIYLTGLFDVPVSEYRDTPPGFTDAASFVWRVAFPLPACDDYHFLGYQVSRTLGLIPKASTHEKRVIKDAYAEIGQLARQPGASVVLVVVGRNVETFEFDSDQLVEDFGIADAHSALLTPLSEQTHEAYNAQYLH